MRDRLIELLEKAAKEMDCPQMDEVADYLLANGVIVPPCDEEVRVALRCHADERNRCDICPYRERGGCSLGMSRDALALINRQKASLQEVITLNSKLEAENAKLQRLLDFYEETSGNKKAKSEAIKEFAWRLKNRLTPYPEAPFCEMVGSLDIDALVKEMTEENK